MFLTSFWTSLIGKQRSLAGRQDLGVRWMNGQTFRRRWLGEMWAWAFIPLPMHPAYCQFLEELVMKTGTCSLDGAPLF